MKWLFLSIIILYSFFLPSQTLDPYSNYSLLQFSPVAYRLCVLVVIILAVNLLVKTTTKEQIISSIYLAIKPLTKLKVNVDSFLIRTYLTLDMVDSLNHELKKHKQKKDLQSVFSQLTSWLEKSTQVERDVIIFEELSYPCFIQTLIPILLCFCYVIIYISN